MSTAAHLHFRGRLGNTPELRYTQSGKAVTNFNLAIDQGYGEHKTTAWVRVTVWEKQAEAVAAHLSQGDLVACIASQFRVSTWTGQDGTPQGQLEVTAQRVDFIITKREPQDAAVDEGEEIPF